MYIYWNSYIKTRVCKLGTNLFIVPVSFILLWIRGVCCEPMSCGPYLHTDYTGQHLHISTFVHGKMSFNSCISCIVTIWNLTPFSILFPYSSILFSFYQTFPYPCIFKWSPLFFSLTNFWFHKSNRLFVYSYNWNGTLAKQ